MSSIHVRQIKASLEQTFSEKIDMRDWNKKSADSKESAFLSTLFPDVYAGNLFKNLKKCRELLDLVMRHLS
jgi:hypothetical protein